MTFQRIISVHRTQKDQWHLHLVLQLTVKAQLAFVALSSVEAKGCYVLRLQYWPGRYDDNKETYH